MLLSCLFLDIHILSKTRTFRITDIYHENTHFLIIEHVHFFSKSLYSSHIFIVVSNMMMMIIIIRSSSSQKRSSSSSNTYILHIFKLFKIFTQRFQNTCFSSYFIIPFIKKFVKYYT